jgi:hypothetical protein
MAKVLFIIETRGIAFRWFGVAILRTPYKEVWLKDMDRNLSDSGSVLLFAFIFNETSSFVFYAGYLFTIRSPVSRSRSIVICDGG